MRTAVATSPKGLRVRGIAGTYVVLIAMDCDPAYCQGLLGFAIRRTDVVGKESIWLRGLKKFDLPNSDEGDSVTTLHHPIQKFHWGDYTAHRATQYIYEVYAMRGTKTALVQDDMVAVTVTTEHEESVGKNGHAVHYNRSAASSQAFATRFPSLPKGEVTDPNARTWLSRGLLEALIGFIDETQPGEGLRLFLYEFDKREIAQALKSALARGVSLEILHDAIIGPDGKGPINESRPLLHEFGLDAVAKDRTGAGLAISHNKFMVRVDATGAPVKVWTGSTNFTDAGIYAQSNVGHAIADPKLAKSYFDWHQEIWNDPSKSVANSRVDAAKTSPVLVPNAAAPFGSGTTMMFSPRATTEAITLCAELIGKAGKMVCFTAPFALHDDLEKALIAADAQVYGLLNKHGVVEQAMYAAPNTSLAAAGALDKNSVLEAWQNDMLQKLKEESLHHSGVYIHTKIILIDPLSDHPIVICGSANFSNNSSRNNDENQLFIFDEPEVADVYIGEFMRMFDHYYFRDKAKVLKAQSVTDPKAAFLDETDHWTQRFFNGGDHERQRLAFF